jgi:hypothetical protein
MAGPSQDAADIAHILIHLAAFEKAGRRRKGAMRKSRLARQAAL